MKPAFFLTALAVSLLPALAQAQSLLDRVQGLYSPAFAQGSWNCRDLGSDGGAVGIQGTQLLGVESACSLDNPFPIPGMDAIRFTTSCAGEGMTWDGGPVILMASDAGVYVIREGFVTEWVRCPG